MLFKSECPVTCPKIIIQVILIVIFAKSKRSIPDLIVNKWFPPCSPE